MLDRNVNERFRQLLLSLNKDISDVVTDVGGTPAKYYRLYRDEVKPNFDTLFELINAYPQINGDWLLTGRGQMFNGSNTEESQKIKELETKVSILDDLLIRALGKNA